MKNCNFSAVTLRQKLSLYLQTMIALTLAGFCLAVMLGPDLGRAQTIGQDKYKHAAVSSVLGLVARTQVHDPVKAWALAMVPGVAKEVWDAKRRGGTGFSWGDIAADAIGAYVGVKLGGVIINHRSITYTGSF